MFEQLFFSPLVRSEARQNTSLVAQTVSFLLVVVVYLTANCYGLF